MSFKVQVPKYSIRCGDSSDLICCFVSEFEQLQRKGYSKEEAMNELGILKECCRVKLITYSKKFLDLENREYIEGLIPYTPDLKPNNKVIETEGMSLGFIVKMNPNKNYSEVSQSNQLENEPYRYPDEIGIPAINKGDFPDTKKMIFVGAGKSSEYIAGRKYLCR